MVLHEKGIDFETYEVDLSNKSEEFLAASPTGKVPVVVVEGESLYESNVVNQYLEEVSDEPRLMPEDPKARAHARIWMAFADTDFFPAVFVASVGRARGFTEERISEGFEKLRGALAKLEARRSRLPRRRVFPRRRGPRGQLRAPARARGEGRGVPGPVPQRRGLGGANRGQTELQGRRLAPEDAELL
jgi:glutathione S-transferase